MLQVEHLTKRYGAVTAVDDLSFEIAGAGSTGGEGSGGALAQYGLSLGVFAAALVFALLYRRRPRRR